MSDNYGQYSESIDVVDCDSFLTDNIEIIKEQLKILYGEKTDDIKHINIDNGANGCFYVFIIDDYKYGIKIIKNSEYNIPDF